MKANAIIRFEIFNMVNFSLPELNYPYCYFFNDPVYEVKFYILEKFIMVGMKFDTFAYAEIKNGEHLMLSGMSHKIYIDENTMCEIYFL